jgi:hypothetical protein
MKKIIIMTQPFERKSLNLETPDTYRIFAQDLIDARQSDQNREKFTRKGKPW